MKKFILLSIIAILSFAASFAQNVGIGTTTPNASAQLDVTSTSKGILIPRMATSSITSITNPAKGLMVYDSIKNQLMVNMGKPAAPNWRTIEFNSGWELNGNGGTNPVSQFIGTTDNQPLHFRINNIQVGELHPSYGNILWGLRAAQSNTTGYSNIAIGTDVLKLNTDRSNLIAIGDSALFNNGAGDFNTSNANDNTAIGSKSLYSNTSGYDNTGVGFQTLYSNTFARGNTAIGSQALYSNITGDDNTSTGFKSLYNNNSGYLNTAYGMTALFANVNGNRNTATGNTSMFANISGSFNTADGDASLHYNTIGSDNTAIGVGALGLNEEGSYNTGVGVDALFYTTNSQFNTAIGYNAGFSNNLGYNNTILGANCGVNGAGFYNCIAIGQGVTCNASSQAIIGNSATNFIGGYADWTNISDGRYKKNVQENVKGLEFIMKLRPVTYLLDVTGISNKLNESRGKEINEQQKKAITEKEQIVQTGFIAQEVEKAANETGYDFSGVYKPKNENDFYGLRYSEFVAPLIKAVQEQQLLIETQKKDIDTLKAQVAELTKAVKTLMNK